ncbi:MAG TPA: LLM class F420-dependent oxidoreductase [Ktedonobacteraceae bacterium]|nr:LLM class F420-dependent oxidoreductase [Ktedonobacteraceae bacterium]
MSRPRPFRFGVSVHGNKSRKEWIDLARQVEDLGYSTLLIPDHLGEQLSPIPALLLAADATTTLRVGSLVFDNDFRHPAVLAKEAATLDVLSEGRLELGLGAGWLKSEYDRAGMPFDRPGTRIERMEEAVQIIKGLFADGPVDFAGKHYTITDMEGFPKPVQRPHPPILIGGGGQRLLSIAGREADIVGFIPKARTDGKGQDLTDATPEALGQKIAWVREAAGARFDELELGILVAQVITTEDREDAAQFIANTMAAGLNVNADQVLQTPYLLLGSEDQICEDLLKRRERYGISYINIFEQGLEALAPIVARLAGT